MRKRSLALLVLTTGCAVRPHYAPPAVRVPPRYQQATDSLFSPQPLSSPFWTELGDSTLVQLVGEGLRANLNVLQAEARVRQARASRRLTAFDLLPTITASGGYTRERIAQAQTFSAVPLTADQRTLDLWDAGFNASWEINVFGRVRRNLQAQGALLASSEGDLRFVQVSLASELARTYFELRGAQAQLAVSRRNADIERRTLGITQQRLNAGRGTALDTERARALLSTTLSVIPTFEARVASAQYRIGVLLGRTPEELPAELLTPTDLPTLPQLAHVGAPEELVKRRPDVVAAERQLAARTALIGAAQADYLPRVTVGGSLGLTATAFDSLSKSGASRFAVGPAISWPFLDLGRVKSRVEITRAQADQAKAAYRSAVLQALAETETALNGYDRSRARLTDLATAAQASEHAAELAQLRFDGGAADFLEVLNAQRTELEAQNQLAQGRTMRSRRWWPSTKRLAARGRSGQPRTAPGECSLSCSVRRGPARPRDARRCSLIAPPPPMPRRLSAVPQRA